jgi:hypothetical protein
VSKTNAASAKRPGFLTFDVLQPALSLTKGLTAPWLLIVIACGLASANIWTGPGILQTHAGGDSPFLLQRTYELAAILRAGVFPARWMPDAAFGLGYPFFNYYAALPYYLAALLNLAGFDLITAIKLAQTIGMFAAAGTMWLFARAWLPRPGALLATLAYTLAPYHLVNIYVRGDSLQEFFAFTWFPLILWGVERALRVREAQAGRLARLGPALLLALALAALVLTHNVSALIFAPFIVLYTLIRLIQHAREQGWRALAQPIAWLAVAALLALALSAWFWLPALGESSGAQLGDQTTGYFDFNNHFRAGNLVQAGLVFDYHVDPALNAFAMALPQAALAALGALIWLLRGRRRFSAVLVLALFAVSTLMITPLSKPIWDALPLLQLAQFPWRFLSVQALFTALLIGGLGGSASGQAGKWASEQVSKSASVAYLRPCILASLLTCIPACLLLLTLPGLPNERLDVRAEDVTPQSLQLYEWFSGNIGTTIRAEYLPAAVRPRPVVGPDLLQQPRRALAVDGVIRSSELLTLKPAEQMWRIRVDSDVATFTLPVLYWPAWRAHTLGASWTVLREIPLSPYAGSGWVMLSLPKGEHYLGLSLVGTSLQKMGEGISLVALAILITLVVVGLTQRLSWPRILLLVGCAALIGVGTVALAQVYRLLYTPVVPALQTVDYNDRQFPNRNPIQFRDAQGQVYELTGATLDPPGVRAGQPFTLTTTWRDDRAPAQIGVHQELPSGGYFASLFRFASSTTYGPPQLSLHTALTVALPGPLLLKLLARDAGGGVLTPTTPSGHVLDRTFLTGLTVVAAAPASDRSAEPLPIRTFPNGIALNKLDWYHPTDHDICFRATWSSLRPPAAALQVSFLLRGSDGRDIARADTQPQAGLAPTWSWPTGVPVPDSYCVPTGGRLRQG